LQSGVVIGVPDELPGSTPSTCSPDILMTSGRLRRRFIAATRGAAYSFLHRSRAARRAFLAVCYADEKLS
jgi:hypothetical protein